MVISVDDSCCVEQLQRRKLKVIYCNTSFLLWARRKLEQEREQQFLIIALRFVGGGQSLAGSMQRRAPSPSHTHKQINTLHIRVHQSKLSEQKYILMFQYTKAKTLLK